ncbi:MAG: phosphoribosylaminoimidazolesuccinocarboxamide synthase [Candidatus Brocadiia bacterium]
MPEPVVETDLEGLDLVNRGKVRDMYALDDRLLIVTTDRISAYDSVLGSAIPWKGKVLTHLTRFWLDYLSSLTAHHLITTDVAGMGADVQRHRTLLEGRSMLVKRAEVLPVECVVRGYLSGSAWRSYRDSGSICGVQLPEGLEESDKLPEPVFTPATKAETGHDENIPFERMRGIVGDELAEEMRDRSLAIYGRAAAYAAERGIIISDTKFEWGLVDDELTLVDEVLTPDSSRFWPADTYEPGGPQFSYDKQFVRDWLDESGWDHQPPAPELPDEVVRKTAEKYLEACRVLTGDSPAD